MAGARGLANEVRTGLEASVSQKVGVAAAVAQSPLDEIWMGKPVRQHVKEFGAIFATLFLIICSVKTYKGVPLQSSALWFALAAFFGVLGYAAPGLLAPLWRGWMKLAHYLSIVMTAVLLSLVWCIGFLPMAGIVRLCGIRVIDQSYRSGAATYWIKRDPKYDDFSRLKQQY